MARIAFYQAAILDTRPGAELRTALEEAKKSNANIILGDRVGDSILISCVLFFLFILIPYYSLPLFTSMHLIATSQIVDELAEVVVYWV